MDDPGADAEHADNLGSTAPPHNDPASYQTSQTAPVVIDSQSQGAVVRAISASQPGAVGSFGLEKAQWLMI